MASAVIKLRFLDEDGLTEHYKRFAISDDSLTVAAALQNGLDRLEQTTMSHQLSLYGQKRGSDRKIRVRMDDFIETDHDYSFIDPRLEGVFISFGYLFAHFLDRETFGMTSNTTAVGPSTPSSARRTFVRRPAFLSSPTTPVSSRTTFAAISPNFSPTVSTISTLAEPISSLAANTTPLRHPSGTAAISVFDRPVCAQRSPRSVTASNDFVSPAISAHSPKITPLSKNKKLNNFYVENVTKVDEFFASKKDADGRMFHEVSYFFILLLHLKVQIDVLSHFGFFHHRKTAFYILCRQQHPDLYEAAEFVITDACFDILRVIWPK